MTKASTVYSFVLAYTTWHALVHAQQICSKSDFQNNGCSSNTACACLHRADEIKQHKYGICALLERNCSKMTPCDETFACAQPNTICVRDDSCHSRNLCYPLSRTTSDVCPPRTALELISADGICATATWTTVGKTVAGGDGPGADLNQLNSPFGLFVDPNDNDALIIVDSANGRVVKWDQAASSGTVVAGGNGMDNRTDQLAAPRYVTVDQEGTLFITEYTNKRVSRWKRGAQHGEIIISNMYVNGITLRSVQDEEQYLFVSDWYEARVRKFDKNGTGGGQLVIGGKGPGVSFCYSVSFVACHLYVDQ